MTQAKVQSLEEMARETCGCQDCAKWGHEGKCKAVDIAALARTYANQRLRDAAARVRGEREAVNHDRYVVDVERIITAMIEGEP